MPRYYFHISASDGLIRDPDGTEPPDLDGIPPPKGVCPDLVISVKCMAYVMRYNHFTH